MRHLGGWRTHCEVPGEASSLASASPLSKPTAMIIARDPMTGALIGSLVEVSGFEPVFPSPSDDIRAAIAAVQPSVVLMDCDADEGESCIEPVGTYGGTIILFSPWRVEPEVREIATRLGLRHFALPIAWSEFRRLIQQATSTERDA